MNKKILVTGAAGFIGYHVACKFCNENYEVFGVDNLNSYYDVELKKNRLSVLKEYKNFKFIKLDIKDIKSLDLFFKAEGISKVIHLASQAGVRYSIENPLEYVNSNLIGHFSILEACKKYKVEHLIYASSSSVYGLNDITPFSTQDRTDHPISFYAATKKSNELMSHSYSHLYNIPMTAVRFFTVYGPWGRPDMAAYKFADLIMKDEEIPVFNKGNLIRDFTYIDDVVEGVYRISKFIPKANPNWSLKSGKYSESKAPHNIYNFGGGKPVNLMDFISTLEKHLGKKAKYKFLDMQRGDVYKTEADANDIFKVIDYKPYIEIENGIKLFVKWYKNYHSL